MVASLHDRAFQAAQGFGQRKGIAGAMAFRADHALAGDARGNAANLRADAGVALGAGREAVFFGVGHRGTM
jgi:hypothetical protein